ncbi:MAG: metal-sensitive transcriptional regulator [Myxococcota bacterium]
MPPEPDRAASSSAQSSSRSPEHAAQHAALTPEIIQRLKSVEGHVRGIQKMVAEEAYCIDVLKQIKAVKQALERVGTLTLETHLQTCVTEGLRSDEVSERERVIEEIVELLGASGKL